MGALRLFFLLIISGWFACGSAHAERRVALVIGNSAYKSVPKLPNPVNDATAFGLTLKNAGFDLVITQLNVNNVEMRKAFREFADQTQESDIAVIFYSGYGIELDGENYLVPIDARLERDTDIVDETVSLDRVLLTVEPTKALRLVILDACRGNPFATKRTSTSLAVGLATVAPRGPNTLIAFSAKASSTAADGDGKNSPYTIALARHLTTPGLDVRLAFGRVRDDVLKATGNRQEPFVYGSLGGNNISLVPAPTAAPSEVATREDYQVAKQLGDREAWEDFLNRYPSGVYADLARSQLRAEKAREEASRVASVEERRQGELQARLAADRAQKDELDALKALLPNIKGIVPVYFATNRKLNDKSPVSLENITYARSRISAFGRVLVSIPIVHKLGVVETPSTSWFGFKEDENSSKHFKVQSITKLSRADFVAAMANPSDSLMLFVHGYNVSFGDAAFKAAQIAYDAHYQGRVLMFSWPSKAGLFDYDYDRESATFSSDALFELLKIIKKEAKVSKLFIVAHSLGSEVVIGALNQAYLSGAKLGISELIFAAADVSADLYLARAEQIKAVADKVTLYASSQDRALLASLKKAQSTTRMGYVLKTGPVLVNGVETIDVSAVGDDMFALNHSTFSTSRAVLDDIGRLITTGDHPPNKRTPTLLLMPDDKNPKYWMYPY